MGEDEYDSEMDMSAFWSRTVLYLELSAAYMNVHVWKCTKIYTMIYTFDYIYASTKKFS